MQAGNSLKPAAGSTEGDVEVFVPVRAAVAAPSVPEKIGWSPAKVAVPKGLFTVPDRGRSEPRQLDPAPSLGNMKLATAVEENIHQDKILLASTNLADVMKIVAGVGADLEDKFGSKQKRPNSLEGRLYNFTRDRSGTPQVDANDVPGRMKAMQKFFKSFVDEGMSFEEIDQDFYQAANRLYASHIFIPETEAGLAAKSFDAESRIGESGWAAVYEGSITPPETDEYRFAGRGDDAILVTIDDEAVLWSVTSGGLNMPEGVINPQPGWTPGYSSNGTPPRIWEGDRHYGNWVRLVKGVQYKVKIVFAEGYGKTAGFQLQVQQRRLDATANPSKKNPLSVFTLAPLTSREIAMMQQTDLPTLFTGPVFGIEANNKK